MPDKNYYIQQMYDTVAGYYNQLGLMPPTMESVYGRLAGADNLNEAYKRELLQPLYKQAADIYNQKAKTYADQTKTEYKPVSTNLGQSALNDDTMSWLLGENEILNSKLGYEQGKTTEKEASYQDLREQIRQDPQFKIIEDAINKSLAGGEPTFTPETISQWEEKLSQAMQPFAQKQVTNLNEQFNFLNPQGFGSGNQAKAIQNYYTDLANNLFNKASDIGWQNYETGLQNYQNNLSKKTDLESFIANMAKAEKDTNWQQNFSKIQQDWAQYLPQLQRQWNLQDTASQRSWAEDLARQMQPDYNIWDDIQQGSSIIGNLASLFMPTKATTPTAGVAGRTKP